MVGTKEGIGSLESCKEPETLKSLTVWALERMLGGVETDIGGQTRTRSKLEKEMVEMAVEEVKTGDFRRAMRLITDETERLIKLITQDQLWGALVGRDYPIEVNPLHAKALFFNTLAGALGFEVLQSRVSEGRIRDAEELACLGADALHHLEQRVQVEAKLTRTPVLSNGYQKESVLNALLNLRKRYREDSKRYGRYVL